MVNAQNINADMQSLILKKATLLRNVRNLAIETVLELVDASPTAFGDTSKLFRAKERKIDEVTTTDQDQPVVVIEFFSNQERYEAYVFFTEDELGSPMVESIEIELDKNWMRR